jgi:hypothetical protein
MPTLDEMAKAKEEEEKKAKYKIEIYFGTDRTANPSKLMAGAVLIWESGRRLHGGGDEKMYWCGYTDCGRPLSSDNFAYMHAICPTCKREMFLDPQARQRHLDVLKEENRSSEGIDRIPYVVGERFFKLPPGKVADLLVKTFDSLGRNADVYFKYHPLDMRWDPKHETTKDLNNLEEARRAMVPGIYTLKRIIEDAANGSDLRMRFLAMITA